MIKADPLIIETVTRVCTELCSPELVNAAEDGAWPTELWEPMESTGLSLAWVPESAGGPGASLADGFTVARVSARFAVPVPVAETLCAGWLLARAGLRMPAGPMSVAPVRAQQCIELDADGLLHGTIDDVPYAAHATHLVVIASDGEAPIVALVPAADCNLGPGTNLAGEKSGHLAASNNFGVLGEHDIDAVGVRRHLHRNIRFPALAPVHHRQVTVAYMVTVHVTHQDGVDIAEPWILRARHGAAGIIENPRAVGVFENHCTVEFTELAVVASQRSDFHVRR